MSVTGWWQGQGRVVAIVAAVLAVAPAVAACQAGYSIYFTSLDDPVRRLRAAEATGRFARQLQVYLRPSVLATVILDRLLHHYDVLSINGPSQLPTQRPPQPHHRR